MLDRLAKLLKRDDAPLEVKPGLTALGYASVELKVRVFRAAENRWYDLEELPS